MIKNHPLVSPPHPGIAKPAVARPMTGRQTAAQKQAKQALTSPARGRNAGYALTQRICGPVCMCGVIRAVSHG